MVNGYHRSLKKAFSMISHTLAHARNVHGALFANVVLTSSRAPFYVLVGVVILAKSHLNSVHMFCVIVMNKKFWKELICLLSLHYLKMSFALKPAFAPT
jgi:hypothetical protein